MTTDYLIIGSGIAGLSLAIKLAEYFPSKTITVLTKSESATSNTQYAQGGIAVVTNLELDSFEKHVEDTLLCGGGLCDEEVVRMVVREGPKRLQEIKSWGATFDLDKQGHFDLAKEGGHSEYRVVHSKDQTGREMITAMLRYLQKLPNLHLLQHYFALNLIVEKEVCIGAEVLNETTEEKITFQAQKTILATGGVGQVYGHTTNSEVATGDGIAMASRVNARIEDMEFVQFHPTALYSEKQEVTFLISEAVRGFGAILRNKSGERFMENYDKRLELAPRDVVSQSMHAELTKNKEKYVYLDCTHLNKDAFKKHFPMIYERCAAIGICIEKDWIPVAPSQHYICGGISTNLYGETSLKNLFVCGESARTGLHGANRLASNSLLEALVYSDRIFQFIQSNEDKISVKHSKKYVQNLANLPKIDFEKLRQTKVEIQAITMRYAGIIRKKSELKKAKASLQAKREEVASWISVFRPTKELYELYNMLEVSLLIVNSSLERSQSVGTFVIVAE